jgi:hypothetical protein
MNQGSDPTPDPAQSSQAAGSDPYQQLGVSLEASFDEVQAARQRRLALVEDDPIARARVEAAYDAILMSRLRDRQQGRVSTAARSASQREQAKPQAPGGNIGAALPRLPMPMGALARPGLSLPSLQLASGRELWLPLASGGLLLLLLFAFTPPPAELILSLATLATLLNLQRRSGRFLAALGWSVALLCLGLLFGGLLAASLDPRLPLGLPITLLQVQSLPALLLLLLGALFIA